MLREGVVYKHLPRHSSAASSREGSARERRIPASEMRDSIAHDDGLEGGVVKQRKQLSADGPLSIGLRQRSGQEKSWFRLTAGSSR